MGKNGKRTLIHLPPELMGEIAVHAVTLGKGARLFNVAENVHRMIRADLKASGLAYTTPAGTFDFHALRHQSGSMLVSAGLTVKAVQAHMRHASARMTLDTYGHNFDSDAKRSTATLAGIVQRVAQRNSVGESGRELSGVVDTDAEMRKSEWSDGESNPVGNRRIPLQTLPSVLNSVQNSTSDLASRS